MFAIRYTVNPYNNSYVWTNKHKLIHRNNGVVAGKTGYTVRANRTLVSYAEIADKKMICVSFNHGDDYKLHEMLFSKSNDAVAFKLNSSLV